MAYEDLLRSVEESALEKELTLRKKAAASVEEIQKHARERARVTEASHIEEAKKSIATERNKLLYLSNVEAKELLIRARKTAFEKAFREAEVRLSSLRSDPKYPGVFEKLLREATGTVKGAFCIHVDPQDADLCKKTLAALGITAEIRTDIKTAGGIVVNLPGDAVVVSNTVESRLERAREKLRAGIYTILAGA
jgi:V/A-type H+/Na+-transporting ATPase subunit E